MSNMLKKYAENKRKEDRVEGSALSSKSMTVMTDISRMQPQIEEAIEKGTVAIIGEVSKSKYVLRAEILKVVLARGE